MQDYKYDCFLENKKSYATHRVFQRYVKEQAFKARFITRYYSKQFIRYEKTIKSVHEFGHCIDRSTDCSQMNHFQSKWSQIDAAYGLGL